MRIRILAVLLTGWGCTCALAALLCLQAATADDSNLEELVESVLTPFAPADAQSRVVAAGPRAVRILQHKLQDGSPRRRMQAANLLGGFRGDARGASEDLADLLSDSDRGVRIAAAEALREIVDISSKSAEKLLAVLDEPDLALAQSKFAILHGSPRLLIESAKTLELLLQSQHAHVRWFAAWATYRAAPESESGVAALVGALKDADSFVRANAATVVGSVTTAPSVFIPILVQMAEGDASTEVREDAVAALSRYRGIAAIAADALNRICERPETPEVLRAAAESALTSIGKPR